MTIACLSRLALPLALLALAGAALATPQRPEQPRMRIAKASPLIHVNSRDGQAVLEATDLAPGQHRTGQVTLTNTGDDGRLVLLAKPSPGSLAERLLLTVREGSRLFSRGPLAESKACQPLGSFRAGSSRTVAFDVEFPRGTDDDALVRTSAALDLEWVVATSDDCPVHDGVTQPTALTADSEPGGHTVNVAGMKVQIGAGPYRFSRRAGTARVAVRCISSDTGKCSGTLGLERRRSGQGRGIAMARGNVRLRVGQRRSITLKLNRRARKRVTSTGRVPVRAYLIARDARGRRHQAAYLDRLIYGRSSKSRSR